VSKSNRTDKPSPSASMRLQKRMAQLGIASRRESERLIEAGRVKVNGTLVTTPGTKVTVRDHIAVDGRTVEAPSEPLVGILYKPVGCVCARSDPQGRATIYDFIPEDMPFLAHVGRLDFNTEGVLLMTTDGDLAQALLKPKTGVARTYEAKVRGHLSRRQLLQLEQGVPLDGRPTRPVIVQRMDQSRSKHDWLEITLSEGKNRHVHRIIEAVGSSVSKLRRVSFGVVQLDGMLPGQFRLLEPSEIAALRRQVG